MSADDSQKRVQRLVEDVRRELLELSGKHREVMPELSAHLAELANRLGRAQGLTSSPLTSSYRHQIQMFQRWLAGQELATEPPFAVEVVLTYLRARSSDIAPLTLRKDVLAIKRWHQATGHPDPTDAAEIQEMLAELDR